MTQSVRSHTGPTALIKLAQDVLNTEIAGLAAVRDRLNARTPEKAPLVLALGLLAACTGRVVVTGIGKSGLVGRKLAATFSSTGTPAFFLHPVEGAHGDLGSLRKDDVIIAISNSGETAELNAILPALKSLGTKRCDTPHHLARHRGRAFHGKSPSPSFLQDKERYGTDHTCLERSRHWLRPAGKTPLVASGMGGSGSGFSRYGCLFYPHPAAIH